jgi:predicted DNA-binding protein with PD1-like motif
MPLRLRPGDDLHLVLEAWRARQRERAGSLLSSISSRLRARSLVRTTAELVVGLLPEWQFSREPDVATGFAELQIRPARDSGDLGEPH